MGEEITFRFLCDQGLVTSPACPFTGDRTGGQVALDGSVFEGSS